MFYKACAYAGAFCTEKKPHVCHVENVFATEKDFDVCLGTILRDVYRFE
jgi:hypothetical protein